MSWKKKHKPHYITTPIFYPNAEPHIGHLYSTVIADILSRYNRLKDPSCPRALVTGTDEHGAKIQLAASINGMAKREKLFCDRISKRFQDLAIAANLSYTRFIRTTDTDHIKAVSHFWNELNRRGYIYKGGHSGWYSVSDECFYTETQVERRGTDASGESNMVSKETGNVVEWTEEENYKFRLSEFRERLLERYSANMARTAATTSSILPKEQFDQIREILSDSDQVKDISISRPSSRLTWGIPVPNDPSHVIYVWVDALCSYLTGVGYPWSDGKEGSAHGWPPNIQVIGKDILRFHAIYFPAFLLAVDLPLPETILSHAHWTVERKKMSKSIGNVVNPFEVMDKYESDVVRFYLARVGGRFRDDNDWSGDQLFKHYKEILTLVGNQLTRTFSRKVMERLPSTARLVPINHDVLESTAPDDADNGHVSQKMWNEARGRLSNLAHLYQLHMDKIEIAAALEEVIECLRACYADWNAIAPWSSDTPLSVVSKQLSYNRETLRICGILLQPIIPTKAKGLLDALGVQEDRRTIEYAKLGMGQLTGEEITPVSPVALFHSVSTVEGRQ
ncbi:tRNA synthetases class I (M)-domain-containing protein [Hysterangium stoloniferum]|nr:tRNA synthetases class I (M)-domain-containing protein [Hysterangium stoloniferum]